MQLSIGITVGDCAGIGPEIVDLALKSGRLPDSAEYKIIGKYPDCSLGQPTVETARAAAAALEEAVTLARGAPRRDPSRCDRSNSQGAHVRSWVQVSRTNGVFR